MLQDYILLCPSSTPSARSPCILFSSFSNSPSKTYPINLDKCCLPIIATARLYHCEPLTCSLNGSKMGAALCAYYHIDNCYQNIALTIDKYVNRLHLYSHLNSDIVIQNMNNKLVTVKADTGIFCSIHQSHKIHPNLRIFYR